MEARSADLLTGWWESCPAARSSSARRRGQKMGERVLGAEEDADMWIEVPLKPLATRGHPVPTRRYGRTRRVGPVPSARRSPCAHCAG